jgi:hypothetical protein
LFCCTALALLPVGGCRSTGGGPNKSGDPLVGEWVPKGFTAAPAPPRNTSKGGGVPPLPQATSTSSTAAIAQGDPLPGSRPLRINNGKGSDGWQRLPAEQERNPGQLTTGQGNPAGGVNLRRPEPVPVAPVGQAWQAPGGVVPTSTWPGTSTPSDYDQLQAQLKARGVAWQRLETLSDGYKFTCSVPNPEHPEFSRIYEASARDYRAAIHAALEQIDRSQMQR